MRLVVAEGFPPGVVALQNAQVPVKIWVEFLLVRLPQLEAFLGEQMEFGMMQLRPTIIRTVSQFCQLPRRLHEAGIALEATGEVLDYLGEQGFDPQFGARPLKCVLQRVILNELSKEVLAGKVSKDAVVEAVLENGEVRFGNVELPLV